MDDVIVRLFNHQYMKLDIAGLTPTDIASACEQRIRSDPACPLRPVAKQLEGGSDFKSLLTDPLFEEQPEGTLPRQWGLWKQTDPVALYKQKVVPGLPEFAVAYAGTMFVFSTEENMKEFLTEPKKFITADPKIPESYRLMMVGPKGIGCHTAAASLSNLYGWKVIDY